MEKLPIDIKFNIISWIFTPNTINSNSLADGKSDLLGYRWHDPAKLLA